MHVCVLLAVLCEAVAHYELAPDSPNVGTVLFKRSHIKSKRWNRANIILLQARKDFQRLIPSPNLIETINDDYFANMLQYFQNSYSTVKKEIKNPALFNIMNVALSDALGGYLKIWVLPVTKYAFYAGSVSVDKATNIFAVYEDIKNILQTDGENWRSPNEDLLNAVVINIGSPPRSSFTRSMKDSCKRLSFYEKTDNGLMVPLPVINWEGRPIMLYVPLKNETFIPLTSPYSSKVLLKYYDIAQNCMQSQSSDNLDGFNKRFQSWVVSDITPHLNDDKLYVAFGGILTLMNKTKNFYGKVSNTLDKEIFKIRNKAALLGLSLHWTSKKYLIVFIILFIEIIWCIPTLMCLIRSRRKRRISGVKKYFRKIFHIRPEYKVDKFDELHKDIEDNKKRDQDSRSLKLFLKPRARNLEVDVEFPSYDCMMTKSSSSQSRYKTSSEQITVVNETSLKKILPEFDSAVIENQKKELSKIKMSEAKKTSTIRGKSLISDEIMEATQTLTFIKDSERTIKQFLYSEEKITPNPSIMKSRSVCKCCLGSTNITTTENKATKCCCTPCISCTKNLQKPDIKKVKYIEPPKKFGRFKRKDKTQYKTILRTQVDSKSQIQKQTIMETSDINMNSSKNTKVPSDHPLLRIKIERPKAEIKVGISGYGKCSENTKKPSKIPRLANNDIKTDISNVDVMVGTSAKIQCPRNDNNTVKTKNNNPKISQTLDDSVIQRRPKEKKINITL